MDIVKWNKKDTVFEGLLDPEYRNLGHCDVYYINDAGFAVLNHNPVYGLYNRLDIPEIQDVFVLASARRQGIATQLIAYCENQARKQKKSMIGISVPVSPQFGGAQCLYTKLGYYPDGNGVTYERQAVIHNRPYNVDDNLCLMLLKDLSS